MGRTKRACLLHPILCAWDAVITCTLVTVFFPLGVQLRCKKKKKKKQIFFFWEQNMGHWLVNRCWYQLKCLIKQRRQHLPSLVRDPMTYHVRGYMSVNGSNTSPHLYVTQWPITWGATCQLVGANLATWHHLATWHLLTTSSPNKIPQHSNRLNAL